MKFVLIAACALLLWILPARCFAAELEYEVKAEYLERFTRFVEWPADSQAADPSKPFRLCVIGVNPFGTYLNRMAEQVRIKGKPVALAEITVPEAAAGCDLLFIPGEQAGSLKDILAVTGALPILTVSDTPGFAEQGVQINFFMKESRVLFEINAAAVKRSRLKVSSRLLELARPVREAME